jgi:hypothetical protein
VSERINLRIKLNIKLSLLISPLLLGVKDRFQELENGEIWKNKGTNLGTETIFK